jgi:hypothetical protein
MPSELDKLVSRYGELIDCTEKYGRELWDSANQLDTSDLNASILYEIEAAKEINADW